MDIENIRPKLSSLNNRIVKSAEPKEEDVALAALRKYFKGISRKCGYVDTQMRIGVAMRAAEKTAVRTRDSKESLIAVIRTDTMRMIVVLKQGIE